MSALPCYVGNELVGFLRNTRDVAGRTLRIPVATLADIGSASTSRIPDTIIETEEYELRRRSLEVDQLTLRSAREASTVIEHLVLREKVPLGITPIEVLRVAERYTAVLSWTCVQLTIEEHETIFDHDHFVVVEDKSALTDEKLAWPVLQRLGVRP